MTDSNPLRDVLIDQLHFLIDEIEVLCEMATATPLNEKQITNTDRGPSVKQCYGQIIMRDRNKLLPVLKKLNGHKKFKPTDSVDWNSISMQEIFSQIKKARQSVIKAAEKLDEKQWNQEVKDGKNVYRLLVRAVIDDVDILRDVAQQLYRSI